MPIGNWLKVFGTRSTKSLLFQNSWSFVQTKSSIRSWLRCTVAQLIRRACICYYICHGDSTIIRHLTKAFFSISFWAHERTSTAGDSGSMKMIQILPANSGMQIWASDVIRWNFEIQERIRLIMISKFTFKLKFIQRPIRNASERTRKADKLYQYWIQNYVAK